MVTLFMDGPEPESIHTAFEILTLKVVAVVQEQGVCWSQGWHQTHSGICVWWKVRTRSQIQKSKFPRKPDKDVCCRNQVLQIFKMRFSAGLQIPEASCFPHFGRATISTLNPASMISCW